MFIKRFFYLVLVVFFGSTGNLKGQHHSEQAAVRACIQQLFNGMRLGDSSLIRASFHDDARIQTVKEQTSGASQISSITLASFLETIAKVGANHLDERIKTYEIRIDGTGQSHS